MNVRNFSRTVAPALGFLVLILDNRTAIAGAEAGIDLCIRSLIPALFPFFVMSNLLTASLSGGTLSLLRPLGRLFRIPKGSEPLLAAGLLGGYPVGALNIGLAQKRGQLSDVAASRMIAFCNNAGPAFLFGIVAPLFPMPVCGWVLWMIHVVSAFAVSLCIPAEEEPPLESIPSSPTTLISAMGQAVRSMAFVCGWVVLFRTVLQFLDKWALWGVPSAVRVAIAGLIELTNGCTLLRQIDNVGLRFLVCSALLAFGGFCVTMQTRSVADGCSFRAYFPGKILQAGFSVLLAIPAQKLLLGVGGCDVSPLFLAAVGIVCAGAALALQKEKKIVAIPDRLVYNQGIDLKEV